MAGHILPVLTAALLASAGCVKADTAEIFIDEGPVVEEGNAVTIQCSYTGDISYRKPNFRINGANYSGESLTESLPSYNHQYRILPAGGAYYNLTLARAQVSHNGTTFQCFFNDGAATSNTVTLIVTASTTTEPTTVTGDSTLTTTTGTTAPGQPRDEIVTIAIENGTTVQVGEMVEIRCQYFGERIAFRLPSFYINNKTIKVENANTIQTELADYEHKHSLAQEKGRWTASYTLTLKGARTSDNNSVYQCFCELGEGSLVWSKPVTLTVIGPIQPTKVTASASSTDGTSPQPTITGVPLRRLCSGESEVSLWIVIVLPLVCIIVVVVSCVVVAVSIGIAIKATKQSKREDKDRMTPFMSISRDLQSSIQHQEETESKSTTDATILTFRDNDHRYVGIAETGISRGETFTFSPAQEEADAEGV